MAAEEHVFWLEQNFANDCNHQRGTPLVDHIEFLHSLMAGAGNCHKKENFIFVVKLNNEIFDRNVFNRTHGLCVWHVLLV